jgi:hypothetical protein
MFTIPELYSIGSLVLPLHTLLLGLISVASFTFIKYTCKKKDLLHKTWTDILFNGVLTYLLVWKFSLILLDPFAVLNNLSLLILSNGGVWGHVIGGFVTLYVVYLSAKKANFPLLLFSDLFMYGLLITLTVYWLILRSYGLPTTMPWGIGFSGSMASYHPVNLYQFLLGAFILLYLSTKKLSFGQGRYTGLSLFYLGIGLLVNSNFTIKIHTFWGLGVIQWGYIAISLVGLLLMIYSSSSKQEHLQI